MTPDILISALNKLKNKDSYGQDNISTNLLKFSIDSLTIPLCHLFNISFKTGIVPDSLKTAKCVPVYKSGNNQDFSNYRPISLLSVFSKLQEKIVSIQMMRYLNKYSLLYQHQYGFRSKHNTIHPLLHFLNKIHDSLNKDCPEYTLGIFIDLKKAFDTCDKNILLSKLNHYGFRGIVNCWFHSYLSNRQQYTSINGTSSSLKELTCGVPQGSILGPILFLILINDLGNSSKLLFVLLFADDTTLQMSSSNLYELYNTANRELRIVSEWFKANKLTLNISKTKYILFRKPNMHIDHKNLHLSIEDSSIERIGSGCNENSFKFVGVKIDEFLKWSDHLNSVKGKLASATFALAKIKNILPEHIKLTVYNSLFKPHLEYCNIAWGKSNDRIISQLQTLQKKALRYIANTKVNSHVNPLFLKYKLLNVSDMVDYNLGIFMYKYTNKYLPSSFENLFSKLQTHERNLNFKTNLIKSISLKSIPSNTLPRLWNSLDLTTKRSSSLNLFKKQLTLLFHSKYNTICTKINCYSCN